MDGGIEILSFSFAELILIIKSVQKRLIEQAMKMLSIILIYFVINDDNTASSSLSSSSVSSNTKQVERRKQCLGNTEIKFAKEQALELGICYNQIMKLNSSNEDSTGEREATRKSTTALVWERLMLLHSTKLRKFVKQSDSYHKKWENKFQ